MPWDYGRGSDGVLVVVIFSEVATMQGRAWTGDVETECILLLVQGYPSG
jgi:hypothetical protein